jgi:hypothetical protein
MTSELLPGFFLFLHLMVHAQMLHFTFLGGFFSRRADLRKEKLQAIAPLKTFLPLWKGKGCHRKK